MYILQRVGLPLLLSTFFTTILADLLGPTYPAPVDLSSHQSLVPASWKNLTSIFDNYLGSEHQTTASESLSGVENVTFSIGMFSVTDPAATKLQYHYTSPEIEKAPNGTNKVDGDSIYRIASVSKLFTVFAGMLELTDEDWNRPLTHINPGLAAFAREKSGKEDPIFTTQWDKITPLALAAQLSGVAHEGYPGNDLLLEYAAQLIAGNPVDVYGFPPTNFSELGPCALEAYCSAPDDIVGVRSQPPALLPWATPAYADNNFMLLGVAISNITGKPMDTIYQDSVFKPLGLDSTYSHHPTNTDEVARSVIAGAPAANFALEPGITVPSGGLLSTINDLSKFGTGILNHTLLPAEQTRKWMKPMTHTASLSYSVGAPWEIIRYVHPSTGKVTDIYTKLGDSGYYGGVLALIPDYNAGFCMLNAASNGTLRSPTALVILDYVTEAVLPALEAQAAAEAARNFVGTYVSTEPNLNSSVTISFNRSTVPGSHSGLSISSWISNGTDVLASPAFDDAKPRLLPSILDESGSGAGKVAFQASLNPQSTIHTADAGFGYFTGQYETNFDWLGVDNLHYGGIGVKLFVFDVDGEGRATKLRPAVTRTTLERREGAV